MTSGDLRKIPLVVMALSVTAAAIYATMISEKAAGMLGLATAFALLLTAFIRVTRFSAFWKEVVGYVLLAADGAALFLFEDRFDDSRFMRMFLLAQMVCVLVSFALFFSAATRKALRTDSAQ